MVLIFFQTDFATKLISYSCSKTSKQKQNNDNTCKIGNKALNGWYDICKRFEEMNNYTEATSTIAVRKKTQDYHV